jgi:hypothetical protein
VHLGPSIFFIWYRSINLILEIGRELFFHLVCSMLKFHVHKGAFYIRMRYMPCKSFHIKIYSCCIPHQEWSHLFSFVVPDV